MKKCRCCGKSKPLKDFPKNKNSKDGFYAWCKVCTNKKARNYRKTAHGLVSIRATKRKLTYGLLHIDFLDMKKQQNGVCAVCGKSETMLGSGGVVRELSVDHNHITGKVRGLLCAKCNTAIGYVDEDINLLLKLAIYLEENNG